MFPVSLFFIQKILIFKIVNIFQKNFNEKKLIFIHVIYFWISFKVEVVLF